MQNNVLSVTKEPLAAVSGTYRMAAGNSARSSNGHSGGGGNGGGQGCARSRNGR